MIVLLLMAQATGAATPYADCLSTHINADARMMTPPVEVAARLAIHNDAKRACATVRAKVPSAEAPMLDRIDASMRAVLSNPEAAEAEFGTDPIESEAP